MAAPPASHQLKQNKIAVDPLVSANGVPTVVLLQGLAVPLGLPRGQDYRKVPPVPLLFSLSFCVNANSHRHSDLFL